MTNVKRKARNEVVTKEILKDFFEDIKDFVKSTVKGSEGVLRKEIEITQLAVTEHTKMIKENGAAILRVEQKIDKIAVSVESHETRLTVVEEKIESHLAVHP